MEHLRVYTFWQSFIINDLTSSLNPRDCIGKVCKTAFHERRMKSLGIIFGFQSLCICTLQKLWLDSLHCNLTIISQHKLNVWICSHYWKESPVQCFHKLFVSSAAISCCLSTKQNVMAPWSQFYKLFYVLQLFWSSNPNYPLEIITRLFCIGSRLVS